MAVNLHQHQSGAFAGAGSYSYTVVTPGLYLASAKCTLVPTSGVVITITKNGTNVLTSTLTGAQKVLTGETRVVCAAADVLLITVTANTPSDVALPPMETIAQIYLVASGS